MWDSVRTRTRGTINVVGIRAKGRVGRGNREGLGESLGVESGEGSGKEAETGLRAGRATRTGAGTEPGEDSGMEATAKTGGKEWVGLNEVDRGRGRVRGEDREM